jgi:hypothetical protein
MIATRSFDKNEVKAAMPLSSVINRRVGLRRQGRNKWIGYSPFNRECTPSFTVDDSKGLWHDFSSGRGGDVFTFVTATENMSFPEAVRFVAQLGGVSPSEAPVTRLQPAKPKPRPEPEVDHAKVQLALELWHAGYDIAGTPVETYLASRKVLNLLPDGAPWDVLRFHPACPFAGHKVPAMVALVRNIRTNEPQAIHRTAIDLGGNKIKVDGKSRMALGPVAGGAIKLTDDADVTLCLGIGEGIETVISLRALPKFGLSPVWSLISAGGIEAFPVLSGIECLHIAIDNDPHGRGLAAAKVCRRRWRDTGLEVYKVETKDQGTDLNDVI